VSFRHRPSSGRRERSREPGRIDYDYEDDGDENEVRVCRGVGLSLYGQLKAQWQLKVLLTAAINLFFWVGYAFLSRHAVFPVHLIPLTWLDSNVPFQPMPWGWVYLSEFLATGCVPWLIGSRADLRRYALGLLVLCGSSFLIFLFFPVASPRPLALPSTGPVALIAQWDGAFNAFPSLHAGFVVYTLALGLRLFGRRLPAPVVAGFWIWAGLIFYSTLATKQHYALDLLAGAFIGLAADRLAWSVRLGHSAASPGAKFR
jgi:membrane-associated phospholipid phosphatase